MDKTEIAREIAELMGEEYYFGPTGDYDPHSQPYLDDRDDLSRIEWWCRDRGVWINGGVYYEAPVIAHLVWSPSLGTISTHMAYQDALLAAVRIAAEVEG